MTFMNLVVVVGLKWYNNVYLKNNKNIKYYFIIKINNILIYINISIKIE